MKKFEDEKFNLDFATLKEYFPLSVVLQGIFKVLQDLFGNYVSFISESRDTPKLIVP